MGLDRDKDFDAVYLERAGHGASMVLNGEVAAQWGGGVGWPNFTKIMAAGGKLVGLSEDQIEAVTAKFPFLLPMEIPAGSYPGQKTALKTVGSYSYFLARADLPEDIAYSLAKAIHRAQPGLAARLKQGRDTLPENTWKAAGNAERIHPQWSKPAPAIDLHSFKVSDVHEGHHEGKKPMIRSALAATCAGMLMSALPAAAQDSGVPMPGTLSGAYTGKAYSPYAKRSFPERPLWGDSHLHTTLSMDAGLFGNRLSPRDAYRFARGEEVVSTTGQPVRLSRPLDWLVVADHSDGMGFFGDIAAGKPQLLAYEQAARWSKGLEEGGDAAVQASLDLITTFSQGKMEPAMLALYSPGSKLYKNLWERVIDDAEAFNEPGRFTALIGFEWTSLIKGNNMHRVVIMRDGPVRARQVVPFTMTAPQGSPDPRDLWKYLANYEEKTGGEVLAIPHNGNLSNGIMFPLEAQWNGTKLDQSYVTQRIKWEPLYEATQIKGDGEAHPFLSPDDEFADYETWAIGNLDVSEAKTDDMLAGEYAREALKRGLAIESKLGTNPYKFGIIGATDSHTSLATAEEENFFGKHTGYEPKPERMSHAFMENENGKIMGWQMVASGLAAVWATENTREAIFDAMRRKEVYGTTGPRMSVRLFGGWEFTEQDLNSRMPAVVGYEKGVPMGGDLRAMPKAAKAPSFMVYALRDPIGANLDRIQIVKGWLDGGGTTHEKVYDVSWSDNRVPVNGKLPAVGNTVDVANANWTNTIGGAELGTVWTDPEFDAAQKAFYYARVIEIPTPRWSTYDAFRYGIELPEGAPTSTQERAYTSPIWYVPAS